MRSMRVFIIDIALLCLIFAATAFIFFNSSLNSEASTMVSDGVVGVIAPEGGVDDLDLIKLVRKAAHLIEFALLGGLVMLFVQRRPGGSRLTLTGFSLFYVLAVAVTDEHIQRFSDRSSSTGDIILDFCGAVAGIVISYGLVRLICAVKSRRSLNHN